MRLWENFCFWTFETFDNIFGSKTKTKTYETFETKEKTQ